MIEHFLNALITIQAELRRKLKPTYTPINGRSKKYRDEM